MSLLAGIAAVLTYAYSGSHEPQAGTPMGSFLVPGALAADASPAALAGQQTSAAMQRAAGANKTLFAFIVEKNDDATATLRETFESTLAKLGDQAQWTLLDRSDPAEKDFVSKYGLDRSPMPMVLAIAPNGAITGGFPAAQVTEERLRDALASPGLQQCIKADGVMTFQCALSHPEWGLGRARGVVEGKTIRNILTFPPELP